MSKVTTTIRWEDNDLNDVKKAAKRVGLPVSLFVKSLVLNKVRNNDEQANSELFKQLMLAKQDLANGDYEIFDNPKELLKNLKSKMR